MIITSVQIFRYSIPIEPFVISTGVMSFAQNVYIKVFTDIDIYGVGECSAFPMIVGETQNTCLVLARDFANIWKGKNPLDIERRMSELNSFIAGNQTIKSAFSLALYDIASKKAKLPLYKFIGGSYRTITTDITIGIDTAERMANKAIEFVNNGAPALKVKVGKNAKEDVNRIKIIRQKIGYEVPIRLDANQGWSFDDAVYALQSLQDEHIEFCEQPMHTSNNRFFPKLRERVSIPIMADESVYSYYDAKNMCIDQACDYINIKFAKCGGITEALRIQDIANEFGIKCMIGGMLESRVALTAKFHFALAAPNVHFHDLDTALLGHLIDPVIGGVQFSGYTLSLDQHGIGIGAEVDQSFLDQCESWTV